MQFTYCIEDFETSSLSALMGQLPPRGISSRNALYWRSSLIFSVHAMHHL